MTGGTITQNNTTTTSGSTTGPQPDYAGPIVGRPGTTYTVTETAASGNLSDYNVTYSCVDAITGAPVSSGTGASYQLPFPSPASGQTGPNVACTFTNAPKQADMGITQTASPQTVAPGGQVTYTLVARNGGPDPATQAHVSDTLPSGLSVASVQTSQGSCTSGPTVTCSLGTLASGASAQVVVTANVASSANGPITNTATTSAHEGDPNASNNSSSSTITVAPPQADMGITQTASPQTVAPGGQVTYTLVARNGGPDPATQAHVSDTLPSGLSVASVQTSQGSCTSGPTVTCSLGTLASGASAQVVVTANVASSANGPITNTATTSAHEGDPNASNNSSSSTITVAPVPPPAVAPVDLQVTNHVDHPVTDFGRVQSYTLRVTNHGPGAAPNAQLTDTSGLPLRVLSVRSSQGSCTSNVPLRCQLGTLAPGATATIVMRAVPRQPGRARNTVSATVGCDASGRCPSDTNTANNVSSVTVTVLADLKLTQQVDRSVLSPRGSTTIHLDIGNPMPVALHHVRVCGQLPSQLSYVSSSPRGHVDHGRVCWDVDTLGPHQRRMFALTVRAASGAHGTVVSNAVVTGDGVAPARSARQIEILGPDCEGRQDQWTAFPQGGADAGAGNNPGSARQNVCRDGFVRGG